MLPLRMSASPNSPTLAASSPSAAAPARVGRPWRLRDRAGAVAVRIGRPELWALVGLTAFLNLWDLSRNGWANTYYSAAVRSMSSSWHDFLYASFDRSGVMTVDKPPLALWVQSLSVRVFGYHPLSAARPAGADGGRERGARVRPRAPALRAPRRLRRGPRPGAHADDGRDLAAQQPRRPAGAHLRGGGVVRGPGPGRRPHPLAGRSRACAWGSASRPRWASRWPWSRGSPPPGCGSHPPPGAGSTRCASCSWAGARWCWWAERGRRSSNSPRRAPGPGSRARATTASSR